MSDVGPSIIDVAVDIAVESPLWDAFDAAAALAETAIGAALRHANAKLYAGAEISLLLCDDAFIRSLNARWRGQDKPTNVLSFPAADPATAPILGDIAIAYETMTREAAEEGKSLQAHFSHLIVHGVLHLIGYDHQDEAEAEAMEQLEREILAMLGIEDPYQLALERDEEKWEPVFRPHPALND
ncbi:MAG: rRNA maturation RNase YbeY [Methylovirgula sp.]